MLQFCIDFRFGGPTPRAGSTKDWNPITQPRFAIKHKASVVMQGVWLTVLLITMMRLRWWWGEQSQHQRWQLRISIEMRLFEYDASFRFCICFCKTAGIALPTKSLSAGYGAKDSGAVHNSNKYGRRKNQYWCTTSFKKWTFQCPGFNHCGGTVENAHLVESSWNSGFRF